MPANPESRDVTDLPSKTTGEMQGRSPAEAQPGLVAQAPEKPKARVENRSKLRKPGRWNGPRGKREPEAG
jgi:hypothetical protein